MIKSLHAFLILIAIIFSHYFLIPKDIRLARLEISYSSFNTFSKFFHSFPKKILTFMVNFQIIITNNPARDPYTAFLTNIGVFIVDSSQGIPPLCVIWQMTVKTNATAPVRPAYFPTSFLSIIYQYLTVI